MPATEGNPPLEFGNVRILARDFRTTWRFYRDGLGLPPGIGDEAGPYGEFVWNGDARVGIFDRSRMAEAVDRPAATAAADTVGSCVLVLRSADVDAAFAALRARGVPFLRPPTDRPDWRIRTAHAVDPDGNLIEIYSDLPA